MADRWSVERILDSNYAYRILKIIVEKESGSYATEINKEIEKNDREEVSRVISKLEEMAILKKGMRSRAQYYEVRKEGLVEIFQKLWRIDENYPDNFDKLLYKYSEFYSDSHGTISIMFKQDFARAFTMYNLMGGEELPEDISRFIENIEGLRTYEPSFTYFNQAVEELNEDQELE